MKEGWEIKKLGEVCLKTANIKWDESKIEDYHYIDLSAVSRDDLVITETKLVNLKNAPSRAKKIIKSGDIIFATTRPTLKRLTIIPEKYDNQICSTGFAVLRPNLRQITSEYLFFSLLQDSFISLMESLERGASYPAVTDTDVKGFEIPLPPLPEQQRIVSILDRAFAAIDQAKANAEKNLQNAKELFESYINLLFDNNEWEVRRLDKICESIFAGGDAPKNNFSKEPTEKYKVPIYANAVKNHGLYGFTDEARVNQPAVSIAARGSGTGHTELRKEPFLPIVRLIVCIPDKESMSIEFLKYSIDNLVIARSGSAIPQLTVPMIKSYSIPVPPLDIQKSILSKLEIVREETLKLETLYQKKIAALDELKKSILQKAFAGEL